MSVTLDNRINIAEPLREIISRLGLTYEDVVEMAFTPSEVVVTILIRDENGNVQTDAEGQVVEQTSTFAVAT